MQGRHLYRRLKILPRDHLTLMLLLYPIFELVLILQIFHILLQFYHILHTLIWLILISLKWIVLDLL